MATRALRSPGPEPLLQAEAPVLREAPVMRGDPVRAEPLGQEVGQSLGQAPRVHEDQGGPVRLDLGGDPIEQVAPLVV